MSDEPQGCIHREHEGAITCNKICDPPHKLCPFHRLMEEETERTKAQRKRDREKEKQDKAKRMRATGRATR